MSLDTSTEVAEVSQPAEVACVRPGLMVADIEKKCLELPQIECAVSHYFGPGLYIREVRIPAGTFAIGHHQKCDHLNVMLKGRVKMLMDDGSITEMVAPQLYVGNPGRKIGFIVEDMVWQNIYATNERDVDVLEATYLEKSEGWQLSAAARRGADYLARQPDRDDYRLMLSDTGFSDETAVAQSRNEADQIPFPDGSGWRVMVRPSSIHGSGLFAISPIEAGELVAPARVGGMRTPAGRFTNHSRSPNARMVKTSDGDINLVALTRLDGCKGGDEGTEITIDYRQALSLSIKEHAT